MTGCCPNSSIADVAGLLVMRFNKCKFGGANFSGLSRRRHGLVDGLKNGLTAPGEEELGYLVVNLGRGTL